MTAGLPGTGVGGLHHADHAVGAQGVLDHVEIARLEDVERQAALRQEQRARELERLAELERFQKLTVGRELKMVELKKEIEELKKENGQSR